MARGRWKKVPNGTVYCHKKREKDKTLHVDREPFWLPLSQHVQRLTTILFSLIAWGTLKEYVMKTLCTSSSFMLSS